MNHLEVCAPETLSAFDHVAAWHAMLRIARTAQQRAQRDLGDGQRLEVLVNNTDGRGNSYGSHTNFLVTRRCWDNLFEHKLHHMLYLATYLTSSIVFTGTGKVGAENDRPPVDFQLAQRADHFETITGVQTTHNRPIVNSRDEALCGRSFFRPSDEAAEMARLHVIFFDSTLCHVATLLKMGATQIVLAMIEQERVDPGLILDSPLEALQTWSRDPDCRVTAGMITGRQYSAVEVQQEFFDRAKAFVDAGGAEAVANVLDWGKLPLYHDIVEGSGLISWDSLPHWTHVMVTLQGAGPNRSQRDVHVEELLRSPISETVCMMEPYLVEHGLTWDGLRPLVNLRNQLREIDVRFGMLGDEGIFTQLDAAGVLDHRVDGVDNIARAVAHPPAVGRARLRGLCIRRLASQGHRYSCGWTFISDQVRGRSLDLTDPFTTEEKWVDGSPGVDAVSLPCPTGGAADPARSQRAAPSRRPDSHVVGQHVLIVDTPDGARGSYVAESATITEVIAGQGANAAFRLDIDEGRNTWQPRHILLLDAIDGAPREGAA